MVNNALDLPIILYRIIYVLLLYNNHNFPFNILEK